MAYGDGIGPEIMEATPDILIAGGAKLAIETIEIREKVLSRRQPHRHYPLCLGIAPANQSFLKVPITTPQGGGFKSLNITTRKMLKLYANVRPCVAYSPYVDTKYPSMNVVIVRENEEDSYAGIGHQQTLEVVH